MSNGMLTTANVTLTVLMLGLVPTACGTDSNKTAPQQSCDCREGWESVASSDGCVCELPDASQQENKEAYLELTSCELEDPCPGAGFAYDPYPGYWYEGECMLKNLRDRTEGAYHYALSHAERMSFSDLLLIVTADGSVLLSGMGSESGYATHRSYQPTQRCTLKPSEYFEDCLELGTGPREFSTTGSTSGGIGGAGGAGSETPMTCHLPGGWYTDCAPAQPMCPSE